MPADLTIHNLGIPIADPPVKSDLIIALEKQIEELKSRVPAAAKALGWDQVSETTDCFWSTPSARWNAGADCYEIDYTVWVPPAADLVELFDQAHDGEETEAGPDDRKRWWLAKEYEDAHRWGPMADAIVVLQALVDGLMEARTTRKEATHAG